MFQESLGFMVCPLVTVGLEDCPTALGLSISLCIVVRCRAGRHGEKTLLFTSVHVAKKGSTSRSLGWPRVLFFVIAGVGNFQCQGLCARVEKLALVNT